MTKLEYPGFILWWQNKNGFPLAAAENGRPWYLWPEDTTKREELSPILPATWLENKHAQDASGLAGQDTASHPCHGASTISMAVAKQPG